MEALQTLVERYRRPLFGFVYNMTGSQEEAAEVFQEAWLKVIRKLDMYQEDNFGGWLMRIARNTVIDRLRRKKPEMSIDAEPEDGRSMLDVLPNPDQGPAKALEANEIGRRIQSAVSQLPAEQKEVFLMRTQGDLSFKEIAKAQKVSINTALARMQYALTKLRAALGDDYRQLGR